MLAASCTALYQMARPNTNGFAERAGKKICRTLKLFSLQLHYPGGRRLDAMPFSGRNRKKGALMPISLEVVNKSAVLLHIPEENGKSVRVILGAADGPLVTIDSNGHIKIVPPQGDPELRKAVSGILQGVQTLGRIAREVNAGAAVGASS